MTNLDKNHNFESIAKELESKIVEQDVGSPHLIAGCSEKEIAHLENKFSILLPESYKVFLKYFGHGLGGKVMSDIKFLYQDVLNLTDYIETQILIYEEDPKLPEKSFVFASRFEEQFMFFNCNNDQDNSTIYYYLENDREFSVIPGTIFDIIDSEVETLHQNKIEREKRRNK